MPIRPIDMQTMIPKVQEHKQAKDSTVNRTDTDQQQTNLKNRDLADQKLKQVNRMDRRDQMKIREEGRRKQQGKSKDELEEDSDEASKGEHSGNLENEDTAAQSLEALPQEKSPYDKKKKLKSLQYHKFDMKV